MCKNVSVSHIAELFVVLDPVLLDGNSSWATAGRRRRILLLFSVGILAVAIVSCMPSHFKGARSVNREIKYRRKMNRSTSVTRNCHSFFSRKP